jgi:peptidoglycan/LPS O-acetylase OafA/YrhL
MAVMPHHDPIPPKPEEPALAWSRYRRMMKWMALAAAVAAALAVAYLEATSDSMPWQMVLATIAGVGLSVLLGTALMGLVFLSDRTGHDQGAHQSGSSTASQSASGQEKKP